MSKKGRMLVYAALAAAGLGVAAFAIMVAKGVQFGLPAAEHVDERPLRREELGRGEPKFSPWRIDVLQLGAQRWVHPRLLTNAGALVPRTPGPSGYRVDRVARGGFDRSVGSRTLASGLA